MGSFQTEMRPSRPSRRPLTSPLLSRPSPLIQTNLPLLNAQRYVWHVKHLISFNAAAVVGLLLKEATKESRSFGPSPRVYICWCALTHDPPPPGSPHSCYNGGQPCGQLHQPDPRGRTPSHPHLHWSQRRYGRPHHRCLPSSSSSCCLIIAVGCCLCAGYVCFSCAFSAAHEFAAHCQLGRPCFCRDGREDPEWVVSRLLMPFFCLLPHV